MAKNPKLNEIIAIEKGEKNRATALITELYQSLGRSGDLTGLQRRYTPLNEDGEKLPDEAQVVKVRVNGVLTGIRQAMTRLIDISLTKDAANATAAADIVIGETVIAQAVPVTTLLFLEHQLTNLQTIANHIPVLPAGDVWTLDAGTGLYVSQPTETRRTAKLPYVLTKAEATPQHPAQTEILYRDDPVGTWVTTKYSGCMTDADRVTLAQRVAELLNAVKQARERANSVEAPRREIAKALFDYLGI